jgi:hypothetical protein
MDEARVAGTPEAFHAWRHDAKDLWYAVRLLAGAWEGPLDALAVELRDLGKRLGEEHDLTILREALATSVAAPPPAVSTATSATAKEAGAASSPTAPAANDAKSATADEASAASGPTAPVALGAPTLLTARLARAIAARQQELRTHALTLGARLWVERPRDFAARLSGLWRAWSDGTS